MSLPAPQVRLWARAAAGSRPVVTSVKLTGDVRTSAEPLGSTVHATVAGEATLPLTCSANNRRISSAARRGNDPPWRRFAMEFDSEIFETECVN